MRLRLLLGVVVAVSLAPGPMPLPAAAARRDVVHVFPGKGALQRGLDRAGPRDVVRVHKGRYGGPVVIEDPITVKGVGGRVVIDGKCQTQVVVDVQSDNVTLRGLTVQGAQSAPGAFSTEVNVNFVGGFRAREMVFRDTCDALYGLNLYQTGTGVVIRDSVGHGFSDTAFYVGDIHQGSVVVRDNRSSNNYLGFIVENSDPGTVTLVENKALANRTGDPPSGIFVHNSDGAVIIDNVIRDSGSYGIHVDATSEGNQILNNVISGSGSLDAFDEGTGNCWNGTVTGSRQPDPLPTC
ncbi:MAG: right-handed parallel beta-helix repeat-containing protein [Actinomycetota bacterium]